MALLVGADVGGTFTDVVVLNAETGEVETGKVLTTSSNPADGVMDAIYETLSRVPDHGAAARYVVHGTTLVANAVVERKGCKVAALVTEGFRDLFEIGREGRHDIYDLMLERPEPLVPRWLSLDVPERTSSTGASIKAPDPRQAAQRVRELVERGDVQAVAVCFLHSYLNGAHERAVRKGIQEELDDLVPVSLSSEVAPEIREYERASTTSVNAYVQPLVTRYLSDLVSRIAHEAVAERLFVMLSHGGLGSVDAAHKYPIRILESGPAGGAAAAAFLAASPERPHLIAFDMGGTTAKVCFIDNGELTVASEWEAARVSRFKRGSGIPVVLPVVELIEVGAGGGSIATPNDRGLISVGPNSAGAEPGPACYGRGGDSATVTDAAVVLGYLDGGTPLGQSLYLDERLAEAAVARLGEELDLEPVDAAWGVQEIVNANMLRALQMHAFDNGKDVRHYTLVASGGAGPMHACRLAQLASIDEVIIPRATGVASALGFVASPASFDVRRTWVTKLDDTSVKQVAELYEDLVEEAFENLARAGVERGQAVAVASAEMRYEGQSHTVTVSLPPAEWSSGDLTQAFEARYTELYGDRLLDRPVEGVNWQLSLRGPAPLPSQPEWREGTTDVRAAETGVRRAYFPESGGYVSTPVYARNALARGTSVEGPCLVQDTGATIVIPPGSSGKVDSVGSLVIKVG